MQPLVIPQPRTPAIPYHRGSGVQTILRMDLSEIPHGCESATRTPQRHIAAGANQAKIGVSRNHRIVESVFLGQKRRQFDSYPGMTNGETIGSATFKACDSGAVLGRR
jgi:hypothetical protein